MLQTSISTFVHYRYSLEETIRRYARMGYDCVEIWGGRPHGYWEDIDPGRAKSLRTLLESEGLSISAWIPAQFRYPTNLAASEEGVRVKSVDYIKKTAEVAALTGAPMVTLCPGFSLIDHGLDRAREAMLKSFEELIAYRPSDTLLVLEPGNRWETDLVVTVDDGIEVVEQLGYPKGFGLLVDTGHCHINHEPLTDLPRRLSGMVTHYHIDDNRGYGDDHLVPGEGSMQYDAFLRALVESGYSGPVTVELGFSYTVDPDPAALASLSWMRDAFARAQSEAAP